MLKLLLLLTAIITQAWGKGSAQGISIDVRQAKLAAVFEAIEKQSSYHFVYTKEELQGSRPVSLRMQQASINEVLDACLKDQPLEYSIRERYVIIRKKIAVASLPSTDLPPANITLIISGRVVNEEGEPVAGASIQIKGSMVISVSDEKGEWQLQTESNKVTLVISHISYGKKEIGVSSGGPIIVALEKLVSSLDESVVIAYGKTTQRLNTGNVSRVSAAEIARQPVSNPLAALQGRVPGLLITQSSGVPGSGFVLELRGRTSLDMSISKNDPLIIIDGVPFEPGNQPSNQLVSAVNNPRQVSEGGMSPLNTLNPSDIESIEVLKDADATAIYGSRGANGVILITTKKGKAGKTRVQASFYTGSSKVTRTMDLLNTQQYVAMRREAFANDGILPTTINAPDILLWDTTRYTDLKKLLIGGTAITRNAQVSLSGGNTETQFYLGGGYHYETNIFSNTLSDQKGSFLLNLQHQSPNKKLRLQFNGSYSSDNNRLIRTDLTSFLNLPPNVQLFDSTGKINWQEKGVNIPGGNPLAFLLKKYRSKNDNLQGNVQSSYAVVKNLIIRLNLGFNRFMSDEVSLEPRSSIAPTSSSLASSLFANRTTKSWLAEPQLNYVKNAGKLKLDLLAGATIQERSTEGQIITASNYTNDLLLNSMGAAGNLSAINTSLIYRYAAMFGRINLQYKGRYVVNISGRRDGSSRFGPKQRFASFGAIGIAWIFSKEKWVQEQLTFLSHGKLRISAGVTGNDQIGDYRYLDLWTNSLTTYQNLPVLRPNSLFNPDYSWERNKKREVGLELGLFKDRIFISTVYYNSRSNNQLINYVLPIQSGFSSIIKNFDALVENSGFEFTSSFEIFKRTRFSWTSGLVLTIPKNRLLRFPGLATSSYANSFVTGQPLNIINRYKFLGINPATGIYEFEDVNGDGNFTSADYQPTISLDPRFYGGLSNTLSYGKIGLSFFIEFKKQYGRNYLYQHRSFYPGSMNNQPVIVLNRWQKPGDSGPIQKFTTLSNSLAGGTGAVRLGSSNGVYSDASFIRFKNVHISYSVPNKTARKVFAESMQLFAEAQNLFTITNYKGSDPETQNLYQLPPLRTIAGGIKITF